MRAGPIIGLVLALAVALGAAGTHLIAVLQAAFDGARIVRGAQLASIVDCNVCHAVRR